MLPYLLIIFSLLLSFHLYIRYRRWGRCASKLPGPPPYPFIGNMLSFDISSPVKLWKTVRALSNQYYPMSKVWMTTQALYSIRHPDDLEGLLTSQKAITKGWIYNYLHPWLKTGLLTSTGEKWRHRRRILTPSFHFNVLMKYMDITQEEGENLIKYIKNHGKEPTLSLVPLCSKFTLNIICESAMGVALDKIDSKIQENYKQAIYKIGNIAVYRMPKPYLHDWMLKLVPFLKINRDQKEALRTVHDFTNKVLQERREYHKRTNYKYLNSFADDDVYLGRKKRLAMLDLLLSAENEGLIDEEGIKEEVDTFTFEGHDTTAMAMTFSLMLLAENKQAQDKARDEIVEVVSKTGGKFETSTIQELNYLDRCIKESLRLYPPVSTILRKTDEDLQLKHGFVPAGAPIISHFYDLHRDTNFWTDPEKFDPDRFLPEEVQKRHPFAYLPFSAGPRNCIGQKFAMNELKSLIGRILYHFYLEPVDRLENMDLIADLVIRPSEPVHLKFISIDRDI